MERGQERETTRVGKAINKQDTSRMSNINNKKTRRGKSSGHGRRKRSSRRRSWLRHLYEWCLRPGRRMNGKWQMAKWVSDEWQAPVGKPPCNTPLPPFSTCPTCSEKPAYLCCAYCCHSRPQTPLSQGVRIPPTFPFPATNGIWRQIENIYVLCKAKCEGAPIMETCCPGNLIFDIPTRRESSKP